MNTMYDISLNLSTAFVIFFLVGAAQCVLYLKCNVAQAMG